MITEDKLEQFCKDEYTNVKDSAVYVVKNILIHVKEYEEILKKDVVDFTRDEFKILFEANHWVVNRTSFSKNKSIILNYISWRQQIDGKVYDSKLKYLYASDLEKSFDFDTRYFKSEEEFLHFLNTALDEERFLRVKAIAALYWIGFSKEEIISLKENELNYSEFTIRNKKVSKEIFSIISDCVAQRCYVLISASGKRMTHRLTDSEYVIKSQIKKSSVEKEGASEILISTLMVRADNYIKTEKKFCKKRLSAKGIKRSGVFCNLHELEKNGYRVATSYVLDKFNTESYYKVMSVIKDYGIAVTEAGLVATIVSYREWKKYFFPDEE